jgi:hypothetical protein
MSLHRQAFGRAIGIALALVAASALLLKDRQPASAARALWEEFTGAEKPVLVILVGDATRVAGVRNVVGSERVVAESHEAFAVKERRIVAASPEDVGELVARSGWTKARLEIVDTGRVREKPPSSLPRVQPEWEKIAHLIEKPTLTVGEARLVLDAL